MPAVGAPAPDFTLTASNGETVSLSDYRGKRHVLLAFFPLAFTRTCTKEMCAFRDDFAAFDTSHAALVPISVDSTDTLREYRDRHQLPFELLSDFRREVSRRYGVFNDAKFYANRAYVLIDREGTVRWTWQETRNRDLRDNQELLQELRKLPD